MFNIVCKDVGCSFSLCGSRGGGRSGGSGELANGSEKSSIMVAAHLFVLSSASIAGASSGELAKGSELRGSCKGALFAGFAR